MLNLDFFLYKSENDLSEILIDQLHLYDLRDYLQQEIIDRVMSIDKNYYSWEVPISHGKAYNLHYDYGLIMKKFSWNVLQDNLSKRFNCPTIFIN